MEVSWLYAEVFKSRKSNNKNKKLAVDTVGPD